MDEGDKITGIIFVLIWLVLVGMFLWLNSVEKKIEILECIVKIL